MAGFGIGGLIDLRQPQRFADLGGLVENLLFGNARFIRPTTPTRMRSFAPRTRENGNAAAKPAAIELFTTSRRVMPFVVYQILKRQLHPSLLRP